MLIRSIAATAFALSLIATPVLANDVSATGTASTTNREITKLKNAEVVQCKNAAWTKYADAKKVANNARKTTLEHRTQEYKQARGAAQMIRKEAFDAERAAIKKAIEARKVRYEECKVLPADLEKACRTTAQEVFQKARAAAMTDKTKALAEHKDLLSRSQTTYQNAKKVIMDEYLKGRETALNAYTAAKKACMDKASQ